MHRSLLVNGRATHCQEAELESQHTDLHDRGQRHDE